MFPRSPINLNITLGFFLDDLRICSSLFCSISVAVVIFVVNNFKMLAVIISSKLLLPYYLTCFFLRRKWSCMCVHTHTHTHTHTHFGWLSIYVHCFLDQYRLLNRVPSAMQQVFIIYLIYNIVNHSLPIYPYPPLPLNNHKFLFYNCGSISVL